MAEVKANLSQAVEVLMALNDDTGFGPETIKILKAVSNKDTMYYHQAMRQPDRAKFTRAVREELTSLSDSKTYTVRGRDEIPRGAHILPVVWQMRRK